jgi:hypothetical protein
MLSRAVAGLAVVAAAGAIFVAGVFHGKDIVRAAWQKQVNADAQAQALRRDQIAQASTQIAVQHAERKAEIRWRTRTLTERIPVYVSAETDRRFPLPWGLIRLHDAAIEGVVPPPPSESDGSASDVTASAAAATLVANAGACLENSLELELLQDWVRSVADPPH